MTHKNKVCSTSLMYQHSMHAIRVTPWVVKRSRYISSGTITGFHFKSLPISFYLPGWLQSHVIYRSSSSDRLYDWHWILQAAIGLRQIIHISHAEGLYTNIRLTLTQQYNSIHLSLFRSISNTGIASIVCISAILARYTHAPSSALCIYVLLICSPTGHAMGHEWVYAIP